MAQVPEVLMCAAVNHCFERKGLPRRIKTDNGLPLVRPQERDLPTLTVLWWTGLGIEVAYNKPRCPQQNGTVENLQGTCYRWADVPQCRSPQHLQEQLVDVNRIQCNAFRLRKHQNKTRQELYPQLDANPRRFGPQNIEQVFDYERVKQYLAQKVWKRTIQGTGNVKFANIAIYVSKKLGGQPVTITFDPIEAQLIVRAADQTLLKICSTNPFSKEAILKIANMSKN